MSRVLAIACMAIALAALPVARAEANDDVSTAPVAAEKAEAADGDEVICKRERQMGSQIPKRVCKTRRQREAEREASERVYRDIKAQPNSGTSEG